MNHSLQSLSFHHVLCYETARQILPFQRSQVVVGFDEETASVFLDIFTLCDPFQRNRHRGNFAAIKERTSSAALKGNFAATKKRTRSAATKDLVHAL